MIIYKITNLITNKVYIGQTSTTLKIRWQQHLSKGSCCRFLKKAIDKYGADNFKIEEIDGANSQDELNYKEWLLIHKSNCLAPNGYNLIEGGKVKKPSNETRKKRSESMKGKNRYERTEKQKLVLRTINLGRKQSLEQIEDRASYRRRKIIDSNGIVYISIRQAAKALNCFPSNISANLSGKSKHCNNLTFKYI